MATESFAGAARSLMPQPCQLVIFGAAGDLSWRKLLPAIYNLNADACISGHSDICKPEVAYALLAAAAAILEAGAGILQRQLERSGLKMLLGKTTERVLGEDRITGLQFSQGATGFDPQLVD